MCFKANFQELFKLLKWTINAIEVHWRTLYSYGVWIPADAARVAVESGFSMMDARQCKHAVMSSVCAPLISCPTTSKIYITETPSHWPSQVGYAELGKKTAKVGMPMFRLRPKCHMEVHIVWLGCNYFYIHSVPPANRFWLLQPQDFTHPHNSGFKCRTSCKMGPHTCAIH